MVIICSSVLSKWQLERQRPGRTCILELVCGRISIWFCQLMGSSRFFLGASAFIFGLPSMLDYLLRQERQPIRI